MSSETELELQRAVGRVESSLDALLHEVRVANARHTSVSAALSKRIGRLEKWQTRMIAAGTTVTIIAGLLFKYLTFQSK